MALPSFGQPSYSSGYSPDTIQRRLNPQDNPMQGFNPMQPPQPNQFSDPTSSSMTGFQPSEQPQQAPVGTPQQPQQYQPPQYMPPEHAQQYSGVSASPSGQIEQNPYSVPNPLDSWHHGDISSYLPQGTQQGNGGGNNNGNGNNGSGDGNNQGNNNNNGNGNGDGSGQHNGGGQGQGNGSRNSKNKGPELSKQDLDWLASDPGYQDILTQLMGAKGDYRSQYQTATGQLTRDYTRNKADTKRQEADANTALNDAMASNGMIRSSGYGQEQGTLTADFQQKLADLLSAKKTGLSTALTERTNFMRQSELAKLQARQDALRRYAAEQMGLVTP